MRDGDFVVACTAFCSGHSARMLGVLRDVSIFSSSLIVDRCLPVTATAARPRSLLRSTTDCCSDVALCMALADSDHCRDVSYRLTRTISGGAHVRDGLCKVDDQRSAAHAEPPGLESAEANRRFSEHNEEVGKTPLGVVKRLRGVPFSTMLAKCVDSALFLASPSV